MLRFFDKPLKAACCMYFSTRNTKVFEFLSSPVRTSIDESKLPEPTKIDQKTIDLLEKLSLVKFESDRGVKIVENAIRFADQIFEVDTTNIKPLVSVLEDNCLHLREDSIKIDVTRYELMTHCKLCEENYYIAPPGNNKYTTTKSEIDSETPIQNTLHQIEKVCKN